VVHLDDESCSGFAFCALMDLPCVRYGMKEKCEGPRTVVNINSYIFLFLRIKMTSMAYYCPK
jgi:hypothetical protein